MYSPNACYREVLCHPSVRDLIEENFVLWGGDIHNPEAFRVRNRVTIFILLSPF